MEKIGLESVLDNSGFLKSASDYNGALDGMEKNTDKAGSKMGAAFSTMGKVAMGGIGIAVTAIAAVGTAAFKAAEELDGAFDSIAISTGATGKDLEGLQDDFRSVFGSIPTAAEPAAAVIGGLNKTLGLTGQALVDTSKPLLEMTRLLGGDAAANTQAFARVVGDWGIATKDSAGTLDKLFVASQQSGIGVDALMGKVVQFGAPLRLMGFSLDDSIAMFAKWEKEGVNAELVMGSMRIAAGKFAAGGKPLRESLLATFDSIKNNTDASAALAEAMDVFGARAGPDMAAAIREGRFSIDDMVASLQGADGAILETAENTADFGEKFAILKNKATLALEPLGMMLMDVVTKIADWLIPVVSDLFKWLNYKLVPVFKDVGEGLSLAWAWIDKVIKILTAPGDIGAKFTTLSQSVLPSMLGMLSQVWDGISRWLSDNLPKWIGGLSTFAMEAAEWILDALPVVMTNLMTLRGELLGWLLKSLPEWIYGLLKLADAASAWIGEAIPIVLDNLAELMAQMLGWISKSTPILIDGLMQFANATVGWVIDSLPMLVKNLTTLLGVVLEWVRTSAPEWMIALYQFVTLAAGWVLDALPGLMENLGALLQQLVGWVAKTAPQWASNLLVLGLALVQWIADKMPALGEELGKFFHKMVTWVVDSLPGWVEELKKLGMKAIEWVLDALPGLMENLGKFVGVLLKWIVQTAIDVVPELAKLAVKFIAWIWTDVIPKLPEWLGKILSAILSFIGGMLTSISPELGKVAKGIIDDLKKGIEGGTSKITQVGKDIIDGFLNGMKDAWGRVTGWITNTVNGLVDGLKRTLGIASPSAVTEQIGQATAQGLADGLQQGTAAVQDELIAAGVTMTDDLVYAIATGLQIGSPSRLAEEMGQNVSESLVSGLQLGMDKARGGIGDVVDRVRSALETGLLLTPATPRELGEQVTLGVEEGLEDGGLHLAKNIRELADDAINTLEEGLTGGALTPSMLGERMVDRIRGGKDSRIPMLLHNVGQLAEGVLNTLETGLLLTTPTPRGMGEQVAQQTEEGMNAGVRERMPSMMKMIKTLADGIRGTLETGLLLTPVTPSQLGERIARGIGEGVTMGRLRLEQNLRGLTDGALSTLEEGLGAVPPTPFALGERLVNGIGEGKDAQKPMLLHNVKQLAGETLNTLEEGLLHRATRPQEMGEQMISSLEGGLMSRVPGLLDRLREVGDLVRGTLEGSITLRMAATIDSERQGGGGSTSEMDERDPRYNARGGTEELAAVTARISYGSGGGSSGPSWFTRTVWDAFWTVVKTMAWDLGTLVMLAGGAAQGRRVVAYAESDRLAGYQVGAGQGITYQLNVNSLQAQESVIADFNLMKALAGRT